AHATLGDVAVLALELVFGFAFVRRIEAALRAVLLNLTPYLIELGLDHARRQLEIMQLIELIEQLTLRLGARLLLVLALDALTQRVLDGVEALKAQLRSPFVVRGAL